MSSWLYQISATEWNPERFRVEIWENERWSWTVGRAVSAQESPAPGDGIVFFYVPTGTKDPGFYAWAVVLEWYEETKRIYFRPVAPSNQLKMHPWWNTEARRL